MNTEEIKSLAFLSSVAGVGQQTLWKIKRGLHTLQTKKTTENTPEQTWGQFWVLGRAFWKELGVSENKIESIEKRLNEQTIENYFFWLEKQKIRVFNAASAEYPPLLTQIENSPIILFAKGARLDWSTGPPVAVVGTRHITEYGKKVTEKITSELVLQGCQIVSGCMYGVDICAHRAALEWEGQTVGVLGYGFNHVYPKSYRKTFEEFLERGMTFVTPFSPEVQPTKGNFPARNAIVAGMSQAVVVTEAAEKSGTLITAGYAAEFGRPVFAVPGSIFSPYSQGVKQLINEGATLVSSGEEVLENITK